MALQPIVDFFVFLNTKKAPHLICGKVKKKGRIDIASANALAKKAKTEEAALVSLFKMVSPLRYLAVKRQIRLMDTVRFSAEDAHSVTTVAFMEAVRDWDEAAGAAFTTFFTERAGAAIQQAWEEAAPIRVPHKVRQLLGKVEKPEEAADGRAVDGYKAQNVASYDQKIGSDEEPSFLDILKAPDSPERDVITKIDGFFIDDEVLDSGLRALPPNQRACLVMRAGLDGEGPRSNREIAEALGFSNESSVSVLSARGIKSLKKFLAEHSPLYAKWSGEE